MLLFIDSYKDYLKENVALEFLYTYVELECKVDYCFIDMNKTDELDIDLENYELFGLTINTEVAPYVYKIADKIKEKKPNAYIFTFGTFATLSANMILKDCNNINFVVLGDYEQPIKILIQEYLKNDTLNLNKPYLYSIGDQLTEKVFNVDEMSEPVIPQHIYLERHETRYHHTAIIASTRGCIGQCRFCTLNYCLGKRRIKWRARDIDLVFQEIIEIYNKYRIRAFHIQDSAIEGAGKIGKARIERLCDLLINYPVRFSFSFNTRAKGFGEEDDKLLVKMKQAGFISALLGIESLDEKDLEFFNKRVKPQDNLQSYKLLNEYGFYVECGFININPVSTVSSFQKNFNFSKENNLFYDYHFTSKLSIEYGSKMYDLVKDMGLLDKNYSYINTCVFRFLDPEGERVARRLLKASELSGYSAYESDFLNFQSFYITTINLFDEHQALNFRNLFEPYISRLANEKFDMYEHLICQREDSPEKIMNYYNPRIIELYKKILIKKVRLLKDSNLLAYLRGENVK
ncbi:B12-binding domain-containing radical SAM protein [Fumia xinanensis]|uniref:Radical SAM protein n=1 Tax=Fumia xinanensis TaxID=2763659 RepID=A0A926I6X8_9FIRM|nr:radical SAM protein [Fumia xinanensis]MBC8559262.1 radical SAM protein [Fumia xinanensis]